MTRTILLKSHGGLETCLLLSMNILGDKVTILVQEDERGEDELSKEEEEVGTTKVRSSTCLEACKKERESESIVSTVGPLFDQEKREQLRICDRKE